MRAQKLKQLEIPANIDAQLIEPYQKNIQKKVDSIDLHAIKERVYEKLGHFDYSAFEL